MNYMHHIMFLKSLLTFRRVVLEACGQLPLIEPRRHVFKRAYRYWLYNQLPFVDSATLYDIFDTDDILLTVDWEQWRDTGPR